jgi:hypothetical protein
MDFPALQHGRIDAPAVAAGVAQASHRVVQV